ncbi:hypothetical protein DVH24_016778 [Malus domestica]|uniref:Uncharacterized protein n=1 Tax=Malus domestica TaxID=3750 RepID=A0A498HR65_MALDO|nr:hypothetical protein DVH24_016778 [Malus domestica]
MRRKPNPLRLQAWAILYLLTLSISCSLPSFFFLVLKNRKDLNPLRHSFARQLQSPNLTPQPSQDSAKEKD